MTVQQSPCGVRPGKAALVEQSLPEARGREAGGRSLGAVPAEARFAGRPWSARPDVARTTGEGFSGALWPSPGNGAACRAVLRQLDCCESRGGDKIPDRRAENSLHQADKRARPGSLIRA